MVVRLALWRGFDGGPYGRGLVGGGDGIRTREGPVGSKPRDPSGLGNRRIRPLCHTSNSLKNPASSSWRGFLLYGAKLFVDPIQIIQAGRRHIELVALTDENTELGLGGGNVACHVELDAALLGDLAGGLTLTGGGDGIQHPAAFRAHAHRQRYLVVGVGMGRESRASGLFSRQIGAEIHLCLGLRLGSGQERLGAQALRCVDSHD